MPSDPVESLHLKNQDSKTIGCFPLYPPVELLHSLGITPVTLWGRRLANIPIDTSFRHLQTYVCSVAHRLTEFLLTEPGRHLDAVFGYNACDTLRNLKEIVALAKGESGLPYFGLHLPQTPRDQTDSRAYFENEISALIEQLEKHFQVKFSKNRFAESVELYRQARELARQLEQKLPFSRFTAALEDFCFLPVEGQICRLQELMGEQPAPGGGRIVVSGIQAPPPAVLDMLEASHLRVVGNDLATLARSYHHTPREFDSVFDYYRDFYDNHHPCTTLLYTADKRIPFLMQLIESRNAKGFVFLGEKFCEHEYFEIPSLERVLKERGIHTLQLEFALEDDRTAESVRTRIEAFSEIVNG